MHALILASFALALAALTLAGISPPDHILVFYPTEPVATNSNVTIGLDGPHLGSDWEGFFFNISVATIHPDGVKAELFSVQSGCSGHADGESEAQQGKEGPQYAGTFLAKTAGKCVIIHCSSRRE